MLVEGGSRLVEQKLRDLEREGYAVFEGLFDSEKVADWHHARTRLVDEYRLLTDENIIPDAVGNLMERVPHLILPVVTHPILLAFAESAMGPLIQLDTVALAGDPPSPPERCGAPSGWHRDRFASVQEHGLYSRPLSMVFISYMQRLTDDVGPLRVIPGSHIDGTTLADAQLSKPHPLEQLVSLDVGDVVAIHHNVLHSGTTNVSDRERRFLGWIYNRSYLVQEDNFSGPNCRLLVERAHRQRDRRLLRLLGHDELAFARQIRGFTRSTEEDWRRWRDEDERYARGDGASVAGIDGPA